MGCRSADTPARAVEFPILCGSDGRGRRGMDGSEKKERSRHYYKTVGCFLSPVSAQQNKDIKMAA